MAGDLIPLNWHPQNRPFPVSRHLEDGTATLARAVSAACTSQAATTKTDEPAVAITRQRILFF